MIRRLYERHALASDRGAWSVEQDVDWPAIDVQLAHARPEILTALRGAAIIESFHPVSLARFMKATWDDLDAGVCFSLEAYEGFKHFHVLRRYLEAVGFDPAITDAELVEARTGTEQVEIGPHNLIERLVEFMLSEHLAAYFFRRLGEQALEPVLGKVLLLIAADEVRHAQSASDLLEKRIASNPDLVARVLDAALDFQHYGAEVVEAVPISLVADAVAIRTFAKRIERLCGVRLADRIKDNLEPPAEHPPHLLAE